MKNAGKVLTSAYIIKEVWGSPWYGYTGVEGINGRGAQKIEKNPAKPRYLFTEIGVATELRMSKNVLFVSSQIFTADFRTSHLLTENCLKYD